jgi:hypothetical protein
MMDLVVNFTDPPEGGLVAFIKDYQTLIAGVLALVAALVTVWPVWLQLSRLSIQSSAIFHEFLLQRLGEILERERRVRRLIKGFEGGITGYLYERLELGTGDVDAEWAFNQEQVAARLDHDLRAYTETHRDAPEIEAALEDLLGALTALEDCLQAIHRPQSVTAVGEFDKPLSPKQKAVLKDEAEAAKARILELASKFSGAARNVVAAFHLDINSTRQRARRIEADLLKSSRAGKRQPFRR